MRSFSLWCRVSMTSIFNIKAWKWEWNKIILLINARLHQTVNSGQAHPKAYILSTVQYMFSAHLYNMTSFVIQMVRITYSLGNMRTYYQDSLSSSSPRSLSEWKCRGSNSTSRLNVPEKQKKPQFFLNTRSMSYSAI